MLYNVTVHSFPECGKLQPPVISFVDVAFSYSGKKEDYLFKDLHFGIDSDSRIALVGPNGAGTHYKPVTTTVIITVFS
jgi:ATPase subunit of ABC transporter with duplicated ATPase domains